MTVMDLLFSFAGRIGRGQFWLGYLATIVLAALIVIIVSIIVPWEQVVVTDADGQQTIDYTNPATLPAWIGYLFYFVIGMWITIAISIKRFHHVHSADRLDLVADRAWLLARRSGPQRIRPAKVPPWRAVLGNRQISICRAPWHGCPSGRNLTRAHLMILGGGGWYGLWCLLL